MTIDERESTLTGVALLGDGIESREDILDLGAKELRGSSKRVPVLPQNTLVLVDVCLLLVVSPCSEGASIQEVVDRPSDLDLTGVGSAFIVDERVKGGLGSEKSLDAHGSEDLGKQCKVDGVIECQGRDRGGESSSVQDAEMLLGLERNWLNVVLSECLV